jgi:acetyltransferase-like isoleucine patch superfamily enzyme
MQRLFSYYYYIMNLLIFKFKGVRFNDFNIAGVVFVQNLGQISLGENFSANSGINQNPIGGSNILRLITYKSSAKLTIGNNVGMSNATIVCWNSITIGNNVLIGGDTRIWDTNFHSIDPVIRTSGSDNDIKTAPIKIMDNAFIGGGSIILKGVTIGENSVIAAGSVVTRDIPADCIAGGNPCVVIKKINP